MLRSNIPAGSFGVIDPTYQLYMLGDATLGILYTQSLSQAAYLSIQNTTNKVYQVALSTQSQQNVESFTIRPGQTIRRVSVPAFISAQFTLLSTGTSTASAPLLADGGVTGLPSGAIILRLSSVAQQDSTSYEPEVPCNTTAYIPLEPFPQTVTIDNWSALGHARGYFRDLVFYNNAALPLATALMSQPFDTSPPSLVVPAYTVLETHGMYYGVQLPAGTGGLQYLYASAVVLRP